MACIVIRAQQASICGSRVHGSKGMVSCVVANRAVVAVVVVTS